MTLNQQPGRPRASIVDLPAYKPGKNAAAAEAEHGIVSAIKLASNEGPWGPLPAVVEELAKAGATINRYADPRASELRSVIAEWIGVQQDQVTVGCGSVGLIQQLFLTYVDPGDEVVFPWISFEVYPVFTKLMGGVVVTPELKDHTADLVAIAEAITERTKLIFLANPNNPTGTALSTAEINDFLTHVRDDVIVVIDEAYREFKDPALGDPVEDLLPSHPNLIVLRTFSKAQGLAALRVGYGVASPELIATIDRTGLPFAVNGQAQAAAIVSIRIHDQVMERVATICSERARMTADLRDGGWEIPESQANFVYLPLGDRTSEVHLILEKQGLVTRPFPGTGLRITVSTREDNDRVLAALGRLES